MSSFPKTTSLKRWEIYLERELYEYEKAIIENFKGEYMTNKKMEQLFSIISEKSLYVPRLTNRDGNCLFESLNYHGIGKDVMSLRKGLASILYIYQDYQNFFPYEVKSLKELFNDYDERKYVMCNSEFYKYSFNIMCQDLGNNHSWSKLPAEIILMVVSNIYGVEIVIVNNQNSYESTINVHNSARKKVYLGHLSESHYVPLDVSDGSQADLYYSEYKNKFLKWATSVKKSEYEIPHIIDKTNDMMLKN